MTSLHHDITIAADAASVWDAVCAFDAVHERFARGFVTDTRVDPDHDDERVITFANGVVARERRVGVDEVRRRFAYTVTESPAGLTHHHATFTVVAEGDDRCRLVWDVDLLPHEAAPFMDEMMAGGAAAIAATLDRAAAPIDA